MNYFCFFEIPMLRLKRQRRVANQAIQSQLDRTGNDLYTSKQPILERGNNCWRDEIVREIDTELPQDHSWQDKPRVNMTVCPVCSSEIPS
jgi:hypothetical protein